MVQLIHQPSVEAQFERISYFLEQAKKQSIDLVVLPEECFTLTCTPDEKRQQQEIFGQGPLQSRLAELSARYGVWLLAGTIPLTSKQPGRFYSSSLLFAPNGEIKTRYDKIHLFDVDIETGKEAYRESDMVFSGDRIVTYKLPFVHVGLAICYDLRFPELFRAMIQQGVELILLPSAFTYRTGKVHWDILVKARAIENLVYFGACNHAGIRHNQEKTYGHSMIVGPWGDVLQAMALEEGMITQTIDLSLLRKRRKQFPVLDHYQPFIMQSLS